MAEIQKNIERLQNLLPERVSLVAVSKFHPVAALQEAYDAGQRIFGESRAQELLQKVPMLPADVQWHFIGHLQTNKVRAIVPHVSLIHSIDSEKLLRMVDAEAARIGRTAEVLLQLHVAKETAKFGFTPDECVAVAHGCVPELGHVRVRGVMGMATNTDDEAEIRQEFRAIKAVFDALKSGKMQTEGYFDIISMGMSDDFRIAIEEGSTMVRIGSLIFGERQY